MKKLPIVLCCLAMSACSSDDGHSGSREKFALAKELPQVFYDIPINAAFAEHLANRCLSLRYNPAQWDRRQNELAVILEAGAFTNAHYDEAVEYNKVSPYVRNRYAELAKRVKDPSKEASFCAAGQREMQGKTAIGRYLALR